MMAILQSFPEQIRYLKLFGDKSKSRSADSQNRSNESTIADPWHAWLYHRISLRIHVTLLAVHTVAFARFSLIYCTSNSAAPQPVVSLICLLNSTYIYQRSQDTINNDLSTYRPDHMLSSKSPWITTDLNRLDLFYYRHAFTLIICSLFGNYFASLIYSTIKTWRIRLFGVFSPETASTSTSGRGIGWILEPIYDVIQSKFISASLLLNYAIIDAAIPVAILTATWSMFDYAFSGKFYYFGLQILRHYLINTVEDDVRPGDQSAPEPLNDLFPITAYCDVHQTGASGSITTTATLCALPFNYLNRITFAILWFWYWMLTIAFGAVITARLVFLLSSCVRSRYVNAVLRRAAAAAEDAPGQDRKPPHQIIRRERIIVEKGEISFLKFVLLQNIREFYSRTNPQLIYDFAVIVIVNGSADHQHADDDGEDGEKANYDHEDYDDNNQIDHHDRVNVSKTISI